jgi:flavodoxin short chain
MRENICSEKCFQCTGQENFQWRFFSCPVYPGGTDMQSIAVVYYSGTGNTEAMAQAISDSAKEHGASVTMFDSDHFDKDTMKDFDAVAFGCPAMGVETLEEDSFEPMFASLETELDGKRIALFGSFGWGDGQWMADWEDRAKADGAVLVFDPVIANETPDTVALERCAKIGELLSR